ncbi:MAG: hypothetical protein HY901_05460, partial [Deltaproteobacteria bacterium]|nr:hypothetical protein [Deltaproteobacteria bacterium]
GSAVDGQTLTAASGSWSGTAPLSYAYQWLRCDSSGAGCSNIAAATGTSLLLSATDVGHALRVRVTATNAGGNANVQSAATAAVAAAAPANLTLPTISGSAVDGQTLTAVSGSWSGTAPLSYAYQWLRCDSSGAGCSNIAGATGTSYLLSYADIGSTLRVVITASNTGGSTPATSAKTAVIAARPLVISPASCAVVINDTCAFSASGGTGSYTFSVAAGGGSINPASGLYTAPATAGAATVRVTDSALTTSDATVTITGGSGTIDPGFGSSGLLRVEMFNGRAAQYAVLVDPDEKLVSAGAMMNGTTSPDLDFFIMRHNSDGSLDSTFEANGIVQTSFGYGHDEAVSVKRQADGRYVVAGEAQGALTIGWGIVRYNSNGSLDTSFGNGGKLLLSVGSTDATYGDLFILADGKLLLVGGAVNGSSLDFALVRLNGDGTLDTSFGVGGTKLQDFAGRDDYAKSVDVDASGNYLVAGDTYNGSNTDFAVARFTSAGALDTTFNATGMATHNFSGGATDEAKGVFALSSGAVVVGGWGTFDLGYERFAVVRYLGSGTLDPTFGTGGIASGDSNMDSVESLALQPDGMILLAGDGWCSTLTLCPVVYRFTASGDSDPAFSNTVYDGRVELRDTGRDGLAIAVLGSGKIALSASLEPYSDYGYYGVGEYRAALARLEPNGALDTSFGASGWADLPWFGKSNDLQRWMLLQPDGKVLVGGDSDTGVGTRADTVARFLPDGTLDTTFGASGRLRASAGNAWDGAYAAALQANGQLVMVGQAYSGGYHMRAWRFNADGSLDAAFNGGSSPNYIGIFDGVSLAYAVAIQSDQRIVLGGVSDLYGVGDFALTRLNTDGTIDTVFGVNGKRTTNLGTTGDMIRALGFQSDGKIIAAGKTATQFALARYSTAGTNDNSFGSSGRTLTTIASGPSAAYAVHVLSDDRILAAGETSNGARSVFALARYTAAGVLDATFGTAGKVTVDFGAPAAAYALAVQSDGKILLAGEATSYTGGQHLVAALVRLLPSGVLDTSFGSGGKATFDLGTTADYSVAGLVIQADGSYVLGGSVDEGAGSDFFALRDMP